VDSIKNTGEEMMVEKNKTEKFGSNDMKNKEGEYNESS
jgi:hypothetical protein